MTNVNFVPCNAHPGQWCVTCRKGSDRCNWYTLAYYCTSALCVKLLKEVFKHRKYCLASYIIQKWGSDEPAKLVMLDNWDADCLSYVLLTSH